MYLYNVINSVRSVEQSYKGRKLQGPSSLLHQQHWLQLAICGSLTSYFHPLLRFTVCKEYSLVIHLIIYNSIKWCNSHKWKKNNSQSHPYINENGVLVSDQNQHWQTPKPILLLNLKLKTCQHQWNAFCALMSPIGRLQERYLEVTHWLDHWMLSRQHGAKSLSNVSAPFWINDTKN